MSGPNYALKPPAGWGGSHLESLQEYLDDLKARIEAVVAGEVSAETLTIDSELYTAGNAFDAFEEIAGAGRAPGDTETVKSAYDLAAAAYVDPTGNGGIPKGDLEQGVQDSLDAADAAYEWPGSPGIPAEDLAGDIPADKLHSDVQDSLGLADSALQDLPTVEESDLHADLVARLPRTATVTLIGETTSVQIGDPTIAQVVGDNAENFILAPGMTFLVNIDGNGERTITFTATSAWEMSKQDPQADFSSEIDTNLTVGIDGETPVEVTFDWTSKDDAIKVAAEMQTKIRTAFSNTTCQVIAAPEKYTLDVGSATSGTFELKRDGATITGCDAIDFDESAATVQALLEAEYGAGAVAVTHEGTTFTILFTAGFNQTSGSSLLTADLTNLSGGAAEEFTQVVHSDFYYLVWSGIFGADSAVVIDRASELCCYDELGFDTPTAGAGAGDFVNLADATAAEVADFIAAGLDPADDAVTGVSGDSKVVIQTSSTGQVASIAINDAGTANTVLGISSAKDSRGIFGMGYATNMADSAWVGVVSVIGDTPVATSARIGTKASNNFTIVASSDESTPDYTGDSVDVVIYGPVA